MLHDLSTLKAMGEKDPTFVPTLVNMFIDSIPKDVETLNEAVAKKDWEQVAFVSHKLKSTVDTLNVKSISESIRVLESDELKNTMAESAIQEHINEVTVVLNKVMLELQAWLPEI